MPRNISYPTAKKLTFFQHVKQNPGLYIMLLPGIAYYIIFHYIPMAGIIIAFEEYDVFSGIWGSKWVGLQNFQELFSSPSFFKIFRNSLLISIYKLAVCFPVPIVLAIMINEVGNKIFKRTVQTVVYLPHFLSWVVIAGIVINILSPSDGIINVIIKAYGGTPVNFLASKDKFRTILVLSDLWQSMGWNTIIYLAALSNIDPQLFESAKMDGAGKLQQIFHITLPGIRSTIIVLLLMRIGSIMNNGFEQIYMLYNPNVYEVADVFETYTYRIGLVDMRYGYSTAVGLFKSIISLILLTGTNKLARLFGERGIF